MRKYWIMLALCLAACCGGAEFKPFHGDNYILDCRSGIAISVKQKNGDFVPFLSGIGFDATDKDWKTFFRSAGFRAECVKQTPESALYRFEYRFTGPDAKRIRLGGTLEAHPDYMRIYFEGNFRGDTDKFFHRRILFRYPKEELRLLGAAAKAASGWSLRRSSGSSTTARKKTVRVRRSGPAGTKSASSGSKSRWNRIPAGFPNSAACRKSRMRPASISGVTAMSCWTKTNARRS